jgi:hypothetical protein
MLLALRLVASDRQESAAVVFNPQFRADYIATAEGMTAAAAIVSKIPGQVYCRQNNLVCRAGGKGFVVEDFKTDQLLATGNATPLDIDATLQGGNHCPGACRRSLSRLPRL